MKTPMSKKKAQDIHAKVRSRERVGLHLTEGKRAAIIKAIQGIEQSGIQVSLKHKQSQSRAMYTIYFAHLQKKFDMIYDSDRKSIVTFLSHDPTEVFCFYYDVFGNKINIKADLGITLKYKEGTLTTPYLEIQQIEPTMWYIKDWDKTLVMSKNQLYEVMV
jgi:hypothetical protein